MTALTVDKVKDLLTETTPGTNWSEVSGTDSLTDLGLDSLDKATFFMKVEEALGVTIPDDAYENIDDIETLLGFVSKAAKKIAQ